MCTSTTSSFSPSCISETFVCEHRHLRSSALTFFFFCIFLQMPTHAGKAGTSITGEFGGGRVGGISGTLGLSLERRVSLMLTTMFIAAVGVKRTLL